MITTEERIKDAERRYLGLLNMANTKKLSYKGQGDREIKRLRFCHLQAYGCCAEGFEGAEQENQQPDNCLSDGRDVTP